MTTRPGDNLLCPIPGSLRGRRLAGYFWLLRHWPALALLDKALLKAGRALRNLRQRMVDRTHCSHAVLPDELAQGRLQCRLETAPPLPESPGHDALKAVTRQYLQHRFDLLGSGWVEVRHGMHCRGVEGHVHQAGPPVQADPAGEWLVGRINPANLQAARDAWTMVAPGYQPIDWQLDFKSGYRWGESVWHLDIRSGHRPGADIKLPWELARMQHLAALAHAYGLAKTGTGGFDPAWAYASEFRNQIVDFIATNPPRHGVNWSCTMDVAIRAANWVLAWDLFRARGAEFDQAFENLLMRSLYAHGLHILGHLEWQPELRTNHYLANIVGLLFVAACLPSSPETDAWLAFGVQELIAEVAGQFHADGSNFEASTSYHRLAAETVAYATALVAGLPALRREGLAQVDHSRIRVEPFLRKAPLAMFGSDTDGGATPFPPWYWQRVERMAEFVMDIARPDARSPQIGDNDSGRLFKLVPNHALHPPEQLGRRYRNLADYMMPPGLDRYPLEDHCDHRHLVAAIHALVPRDDFARCSRGHALETAIVASLAGHFQVRPSEPGPSRLEPPKATENTPASSGCISTHVFDAPPGTDLRAGLTRRSYPDFGLYVYRSAALYLAVRCGPVGLKGLGAHAHNDALSIELWIDGRPLVVDPGCYLYTALPARRNAFRSVAVHFSPHFEHVEPASLGQGLFALGDDASPECLVQGADLFVGCYRTGPYRIFRQIRVETAQVTVSDWTDAPDRTLAPLQVHGGPFSDGYGWLRTDLEA